MDLPSNSVRLAFVPPLIWAILFAISHTQSPLYYSNQHQYMLHGLASGGYGELGRDWLANTADPTPVFSATVTWAYRFVGEWAFQAAYFGLLMIYFVSLVFAVAAVPGTPRTGAGWFTLLALLVATHAALGRVASVRLTGVDYPWYLQCGVANQYVLGPGIQPSAFGVFLLASLAAFVWNRVVLAAVFALIACAFHPTYLLPAAWLTLAYMHVLWWRGDRRASVALGVCMLVSVAPIVWSAATSFAPTNAEMFRESQTILVDLRIPHHARIDRWLDLVAWLQVAWVGLALFLVRGTPFLPLIGVPALIGAALSVIQYLTQNPTLALMFPWRISAVLVPLATAVVLARVVGWVTVRVTPRVTVAAAIVLVAVSVVGGVLVTTQGIGYATNQAELPALEFIRRHRQSSDKYLVPVTVPKVGPGPRGTASTTFTPPPRAKPGTRLIPVDLQRFRLFTGAPLYVDFKSIPYKDVDVVEWLARVRKVEQWYSEPTWGSAVRDELQALGITHVLSPADRDLAGEALEQVYADEAYRVFRVR